MPCCFVLAPAGGGGATRDRTADLLNANQALSQLSYSPVFRRIIRARRVDLSQIGSVLGAGRRRIACYASLSATTYGSNLVGLGRFELPTSPLSGVRSNQLSYRPVLTCLRTPWRRYCARSIGHILIVCSLFHSQNALPDRPQPAPKP